jgi:hypothetical protein
MNPVLESLLNYAPGLCARVGLTPGSSFLGQGVHGVVFTGKANTAVKLTRSVREAGVVRSLVGLKLENVVQVYSVHKVGRKWQWLICMEMLHKHRLGAQALSHPDILAAQRSLSRLGLKHMDEHRGNIMRCPATKRLKLIDFGCARRVGK